MTPTLARRLREAREAKGLTQEQVAAQIGTHRVQVGKWETGVATPRPHTLERLAELYGVSLGWLHGATDATQKVARETKAPASGAGISDAGLGAFWALRSVYAHVLETMDTVLTGEFDRRFGAPPQPIPHGEAERLARAQAALDVHQRNTEAKAARKAPARKRHTAG